MNFEERALAFSCEEAWLYGILTLPSQYGSKGVLVLVGGPQYRVGSHRQFTLLARSLAAGGIPVFRFDFRGMGDSEGEARTFEDVEDDLRCAIDKFLVEAPLVKELVIWGLCDAASAAVFYAHRDPRVTGLVLLNPWVRTEAGAAKAYLKHYYVSRLFDPQLWRKIGRGQLNLKATARSVLGFAGEAFAGRKKMAASASGEVSSPTGPASCGLVPLPDRMLEGFRRFRGRVLLILSGNDLTAQEFSDLMKGSREWRKLLQASRVTRFTLPEANHTFSRREWRDQVAGWTKDWICSW
jgi:exosortase A-associated hydrolase 1